MGVCMLIVATVETQTPTIIDEKGNPIKSHSVGIATVFLLFLFIFFYKPSWGATVWIWTSEIFSLNVRAQAVGMASQTQNVANAVFLQCFPLFLKRCGFYTFYFFAGVNACLAVFVWLMIPETRRVALEHMDTLFGGADHVEKGETILATEHDGSVDGHEKSTTGNDIRELEDVEGQRNRGPV
jgi:Sugar (and other) transporter